MGKERSGDVEELTYPLGATARLTGLTPDLLRAWERRYSVVVPLRTPGGTRRYRASDLDRLRMVKAAVDAGYRISEVAQLDAEEIEARLASEGPVAPDPIRAVLGALERLDAAETERLIGLQLAALGPVQFAKGFAVPLLQRVGNAWEGGRLGVAAEHLASGVLRSLLGGSLRAQAAALRSTPIVFATLPGERHELGLLIAALTATAAGGRVVYIGPDLPIDEQVAAVETTDAGALALSLVCQSASEASALLAELRSRLPRDVEVWVGGAGAALATIPGSVTRLESLEALEQRVALLGIRPNPSR